MFIVYISNLSTGDPFETAEGEYSGIRHERFEDAQDEAVDAVNKLGHVGSILIEEV